jgi:hypothetical protein
VLFSLGHCLCRHRHWTAEELRPDAAALHWQGVLVVIVLVAAVLVLLVVVLVY